MIVIALLCTIRTFSRPPLYEQRATLFEQLETDSLSIVMLGNSITHESEWSELFKNANVLNRGISGDTSDGVLKRIQHITKGRPAKIFLMIGINDIQQGVSQDSIINNIESIIDSIIAVSPTTRIYLQSILPVNTNFKVYKGLEGRENTVIEVNKRIEKIAQEKGFPFINLFNEFADENNDLSPEWTNDGLHLLGRAYIKWRDILAPYIND